MITDVSSVGLDFLYLRQHQPMFVADRYDDREKLHTDAPISRCSDVIDSATIGRLTETVAERLDHDEYRQARAAVRELYFGDLAPGESTTRFLAAIDHAVTVRDIHLSATTALEVPA
jgi:CDP-glycerol glycerophosphotransferase (TagB/SpsB family)